MEALRDHLFRDRRDSYPFLFKFEDPSNRVIRSSEEFLKSLSREVVKCVREREKIVLVFFRVLYLSEEKRKNFEVDLVKSFRSYDLVASLSENIYSVAVVTSKPPAEGVNIQKILSRIRYVMRKNGLIVGSLNYSFKIIPYDGVNLKALMKISVRELKGEFKLPFIFPQGELDS